MKAKVLIERCSSRRNVFVLPVGNVFVLPVGNVFVLPVGNVFVLPAENGNGLACRAVGIHIKISLYPAMRVCRR